MNWCYDWDTFSVCPEVFFWVYPGSSVSRFREPSFTDFLMYPSHPNKHRVALRPRFTCCLWQWLANVMSQRPDLILKILKNIQGFQLLRARCFFSQATNVQGILRRFRPLSFQNSSQMLLSEMPPIQSPSSQPSSSQLAPPAIGGEARG